MTRNPYVNPDTKEPILQFKLEALAWYEGYGACRKDDFELVNDLNKGYLEADAALRERHQGFARRVAQGISNE